MKNKWLLILILFGFYSCSPVLKMLTGVKDFRLEETGKMKTFCIENKISLDDAYFLSSKEKFDFPDSSQINLRFIDEVLIFDKNGNRIIYKGKQTGNYCSLPSKDFFSDLKPMFLPIDTVNTLNHLLKDYVNIESLQAPKIDSADFYMIYYWAFWYKKFSERNIKEIQSIINNSEGKTIQCFYLNNDYVKDNYPEDIDFKKEKVKISF